MTTPTTEETAAQRVRDALMTAMCITESLARQTPIKVTPDGQLGFHAAIVEDLAALPRIAMGGTTDQLLTLYSRQTVSLGVTLMLVGINTVSVHADGGSSRMM